MSNFCGSNALLMIMLICWFFFLIVGSSSSSPVVTAAAAAAAAREDNNNPLSFELTSSRDIDEVVRMAGYGEEKLSTVLITGSVHCEAHFPSTTAHHQQPHAWPIPGASVTVNCHRHASERKSKSAVVARGSTDEFGDFIVDLPSHLHAIPNLEKICTVKVHRLPKGTLCRPAPHIKRSHKQLRLSSFGNGIRTYSAGNISLQHSTSDAGN